MNRFDSGDPSPRARKTVPEGDGPPGRLRAAWTLVLLTTVCAELTFTAVTVPFTWLLLPLLMVMHGAGVLVVREAAVRADAGWPVRWGWGRAGWCSGGTKLRTGATDTGCGRPVGSARVIPRS